MSVKKIILISALSFFISFVFFLSLLLPVEAAEVKTSGEGLISRLAPGEFLPISVKLINFGGGGRVDVTVNYEIFDKNKEVVLRQSETVAVQTTATFVKTIQIPHDFSGGRYTAKSSIVYKGQRVPATSQFEFTVEKKIAGIFISQFILYSGIALAIGMVFAVVSRLIIKRRRLSRISPHEYSDVPKEKRLFYEIISDTIMQMRYQAGDRALRIARGIDGLLIDGKNGKVLAIKKSPEKIIALLILQYEKHLGQKVNFALRKTDLKTKRRLSEVDKNLIIIRKYFE